MDQATGLNPSFKADLTTFNWIGNLSDSNQIMVTWHTSPTKTLDDAMKRQTIIAANIAMLRPRSSSISISDGPVSPLWRPPIKW